MTRLWDKGTPLDARVLGFTAGDDYILDNRLVHYDIQASIAHADRAARGREAVGGEGSAAGRGDDARGRALAGRRIGKNPLGAGAGWGPPNFELSREETRRRLGFPVTQEPGTAVQLSRGKAE